MSEELSFSGRQFVSTKKASEMTDYTADYIGSLAREKKIGSRMVGRVRYVDKEDVLQYGTTQKTLSVEGRTYLLTKDAAAVAGYTPDYVGQLARRDVVRSMLIGKDRYIDEADIRAYVGKPQRSVNKVMRGASEKREKKGEETQSTTYLSPFTYHKEHEPLLPALTKPERGLSSVRAGLPADSVPERGVSLSEERPLPSPYLPLVPALSLPRALALSALVFVVGIVSLVFVHNPSSVRQVDGVIDAVSGRTMANVLDLLPRPLKQHLEFTAIRVYCNTRSLLGTDECQVREPTEDTRLVIQEEPVPPPEKPREPETRTIVVRGPRTVVERIVERVPVVQASGVTAEELQEALANLGLALRSEIDGVRGGIADSNSVRTVYETIALTNSIDQLVGVDIIDATVDGVSGLTDTDIPNDITINTTSAMAGTDASFSGDLSVGGTLTVTGQQTLIGRTTLASFAATSTTATSTIATGGLTIGTDHFVVQQTSGNIGIGTTSPYARLSVVGQTVAEFFTATSTTLRSTLPNLTFTDATGTDIRVTTASTTNFFIGSRDVDDRLEFFNGTFGESFNATPTSNGTTITLNLENADGVSDLTMLFSDGETTLDTTPPATISLTAGSDTSPQDNYVYIPQSTKVLTVSTSDWPHGTEHIRVAYLFCQSAATTQTDGGCLVNQNWNDHTQDSNSLGQLAKIGEKARKNGVNWDDGLAPTVTITTNVGTPDNVDLAISSGHSFQFHRQTVSALDSGTGDTFKAVNYPSDAYRELSDLNEILVDSTGATLANRNFALVVWLAVNKTGQYIPIMVNLPSCSYNTATAAIEDANGCTVFNFPEVFDTESNVGLLNARFVFSHSSASGGTWSLEDTLDLRKNTPQNVSGAGGATVTDFPDNIFAIFDDADNTKMFDFQASGITTATTRTYTAPDFDGTLGLTDGGLTAGSILFASSTGLITQDNSNFFWDDTNNRFGIGTTGPFTTLSVDGTGYVSGLFTVDGAGTSTVTDSLDVDGSIDLGNAVADRLTVNARVSSDFVPSSNAVFDLGSSSFFWDDIFVDTVTANSISAASTTISGTQSATFTINSDNATSDGEDASLIFFRGTVTPNAILRWSSANDQFQISQDALIQDETPGTGSTLLTVKAGDGQSTDNLVAFTDSSDTILSVFGASGFLGIGTTSPYAPLSVVGEAVAEFFTATSTTATSTFPNLTFTDATGTDIRTSNATTTNFFSSGVARFQDTLFDSLAVFNSGVTVYTASSTITNLTTVNATSTNATTTTLAVTGSASTSALRVSDILPDSILTTDSTRKIVASTTPTALRYLATDASATSTFAGGLDVFAINQTGSATSTFINGIDLADGCFAINATCLDSGASSSYTGLSDTQSSLTANRIVHTNVGGTALTDTAGFVFDGTNLGVGTTSPFATLSVHANAVDTNRVLFAIASSTASATTTHVAVSNRGNVGIGTSTPEEPLHIVASGNALIQREGNANVGWNAEGYNTSATQAPRYLLRKANGTIASPSAVLSGDLLGTLLVQGHDGTDFSNIAATLRVEATENFTPTTKGASLFFDTIDDGGTTATEKLRLQTGLVVVNEDSNDIDFRVEGNTNANLLFAEAGTDRVGIGTSSPAEALTVEGNIELARFGANPALDLNRLGVGEFRLSVGATGIFQFRDVTNTVNTFRIDPATAENQFYIRSGSTVFNENSSDIDFRIEGDTDANLFFVDASTDRVGIGTSSPSATLSVEHTAGNIGFAIGSSTATNFIVDKDGHTGIGSSAPNIIAPSSNDNRQFTIDAGRSGDTIAMINTVGNRTNSGDIAEYNFFHDVSGSLARVATLGAFRDGADDSGGIRFSTVSGATTVTDFSERMRIDSSGNIGVGTTSPWGLLSVNPNGVAGPSFVVGSSTGTHFLVGNNGKAAFGSSSPQDVWDLVVSDPSAALNVFYTGSNSSAFFIEDRDATTDQQIVQLLNNNGVFQIRALNNSLGQTFDIARFSLANGGITFNEGGADSDFRVEGDTEANLLFVDASANDVGIGTSTPTRRLHVFDTVNIDVAVETTATDGQAGIRFQNDARQWRVRVAADDNFNIRDVTGGEDHLTINTSGNVGIGTTSPSTNLHVDSGGSNTVRIQGSSANLTLFDNSNDAEWTWGASGGLLTLTGVQTDIISVPIAVASGADGVLTLSSGDNLGVGDDTPTEAKLVVGGDLYISDTTAPGNTGACLDASGASLIGRCSSSLRFKEKIADLSLGLETLSQLRPVSFLWKADGFEDFGFVAEEVAEIDPILATYEEDGTVLGVRYEQFTALIVKAIQELVANIEERFASFDARLAALEAAAGVSDGVSVAVNTMNDVLTGAGGTLIDGVLSVRGIVSDTLSSSVIYARGALTVGSSDDPAGITLYGPSGTPYCVRVGDDGEVHSTAGVCDGAQGATVETPEEQTGSAPTITLYGNNPAYVPLNARFSDPGAEATDAEDGPRFVDIAEASIDTSEPAEYTIYYSATDTDGNEMTISRTVIVYDPYAPDPTPIVEDTGSSTPTIVEGGTGTTTPAESTALAGETLIDEEGYEQPPGTYVPAGVEDTATTTEPAPQTEDTFVEEVPEERAVEEIGIEETASTTPAVEG